MGETTTAAPLRRSLIHACPIVIQNQREPALDLRDAHANAAGVIPRFLGLARSREAAVRHPDHRHYYKPYAKQTNDCYEYPTFGFHFPPP